MRFSKIFLPVVVLAAAACNDNLGPTAWSDVPDTVTLYSASRANLVGKPSGFDFSAPRSVVLESATEAGAFDMALTEQSGAFQLVPSGVVLGTYNRAGIAHVTADSLHAIRKAPSDTAQFTTNAPVPVHVGDFLVIRSRRVSCVLTTGSYYAKLQIVAVNPDSGTMKMAYARNPYCGDQSLVPPGS